MMILGLTGSVAMGKSTVASQFAALGAATCNADTIVHELLADNTDVIAEVTRHFPEAVESGVVNRKLLGNIVFNDNKRLKLLENILHPRVKRAEQDFAKQAEREGKWLVVLDIPLLYETEAEKRCDYVAVVTAAYEIQKQRVMARPDMTEEKFARILSYQMSDAEKRKRADFIIHTDNGLEASFSEVRKIVEILKEKRHA